MEIPQSTAAAACADEQETNSVLLAESERGYLSSLVTAEKGFGGVNCPWIIRVQSGQRINLTLFDFGVASRYERGSGSEADCQIYAMVHELTSHSEMTVCGGFRRVRSAYLSHGSEVEVTLHTYTNDVTPVHYVIAYEGKLLSLLDLHLVEKERVSHLLASHAIMMVQL